jgi:hypothetical protein
MKIATRLVLAMLVLVALTATAWANAPKSNIIGSAHDLTTYNWAGATTLISTNTCLFCHVVHKTATNSASGLTASQTPGYMLWNHTISSTTSYGYYSSDSFNALLTAASGTISDLGSNNASFSALTVSNLCLSCHDGTVAIASFYEGGFGLPANGSTWNNGHGPSTYMYTGFELQDLSKTHPVHFTYTAALATAAGGGLLSPASTSSVDGNAQVPLYGGAGYMECTTCHDPHNGTFLQVTEPGATKPTTIFPFPRTLLAGVTPTFCVYCHT